MSKSNQSASKRKSEQLSLAQHQKLRAMMMNSNYNDFQIKHNDSNQQEFSIKNNDTQPSDFEITYSDNQPKESIKIDKNSENQSVKLIQVNEEYDMFGRSEDNSIKSAQNNLPQHRKQHSQSVRKQKDDNLNYMDVMIVEDTNEDDFDQLLQEKQKDHQNLNSDVRESFLVQSPMVQADFDYFSQQRADNYIQANSNPNMFQITNNESDKSSKSSIINQDLSSKNLKDSSISNKSSTKEFQLQQNQTEQSKYIVKSFAGSENDLLKQVQVQENLDANLVEQEDYMDKFFDEPISTAQELNRRRNRRTSPIQHKPHDFSSKFPSLKQNIDSQNIFNRPSLNINQSSQKDKLIGQIKIQDQDMLDGGFKIDQHKSNLEKLTNQEILNNNQRGSIQNNFLKSKFYQDQFILNNNQQEEDFLMNLPQKREKSPDVISINEENLDNIDSEENQAYINEIKKNHLSQNNSRDPNAKQIKLSDQGLDQLRSLQSSITSSIIEKLQEESNTKSQYDAENQILNVDDEILRLPKQESFERDYYQNQHLDGLSREMTPKSKKRIEILQQITRDEWDYKDVLKIIDWNERRHREVAYQQLKENSVISLTNISTKDIRIRVLTQFQTMNSVSNKMLKERSYSQARATCVSLSDSLVLVGNTEGQLWMFDRETEEEYSSFSEKSKDFLGNSVTAIDVHQLRPEYIVLGYERGQLVLIDVQEPKKSIKVIKDHHKLPIINLKFCDWQDGGGDGEGKQAWMFISIDQSGQVIINSVSKILIIMRATKHVVIDSMSYDGPIYASIATRFQSYVHGANYYDSIPIVALGNADQVDIIESRPGKHHILMTIKRPSHYFNKSSKELSSFKARIPSLAWGYGSTPAIKDKGHSLLTIAWGPLIQLVVLFDSIGTNQSQPFIADGYYVIRNFGILENPFQKLPSNNQQSIKQIVGQSIYKDSKSLSGISSDLKSSQIQKNQGSIASEEMLMETQSDASNSQQKQQAKDEAKINSEYDDSEAFTQPGLDIEQIQFFSDSTILVVTKSQEIRILNISSFNPSTYDANQIQEEFLNSVNQKRRKRDTKKNDVSFEVELEYGLRISSQLQKSEYGALYHQTIKFFKGKIIALTIKNIQTCAHLTWQQSVYEFKKIVEDDLVMVFSRALDIFKGNVKGYSGIPDNLELREQVLKEEIKLLVREIIQQVIQKTRQSAHILKSKKDSGSSLKQEKIINELNDQQSSASDQQSQNLTQVEKDFKDEKTEKYKTLIRIAIEFCVELKDQRFLFYDLFLLFKREKLEDAFVHELEPFIMAGRFQEWELPNEVIQNHVLKYYKDSQKADQLEKIIVNLNLAQCPKTIVLEFIHYAEQNFLTTAILYLYTQVFEKKDNTSCVQIIFSLFDLYKKAGKKNQGLLIDIQNLKEFAYDSKEKQKVEKSQIYLGYKILWVIKMFLNGQKFPQGQIRTSKWKTYIHDILELFQSQDLLRVLLEIDAESFFQTISIAFLPSKTFTLFEQGRDTALTDSIINSIKTSQNQQLSSHAMLVKSLDTYCMNILTKEAIKYQYLYFASNVIAKADIKGLDNLYFYSILREQMQQYKRIIENNKKIQTQSTQKYIMHMEKINKQRKLKNLSPLEIRTLPDTEYLVKSEQDILNLLDKCEPMDEFQILELSKLSEPTQYNQVKILLMEKREEYLKCLKMFLHEFKIDLLWTQEMQKAKVVKWIRDKIILLEQKASESSQDKNFCEMFKREIQQNIGKILEINPVETIHLIQDQFQSQHKEMVGYLSRDPELQLLYLDTLLVEKKELIESTIKSHGLQSSNSQDAKKFIDLLKQHLRLCCKSAKGKVMEIVQRMVKEVYYPIEDCLEICQEFKIIEATFLLNRKVGKYFDCIKEGLQILQEKIDYNKLLIELYFAQDNNISLEFPVISDSLPQVKQFDSLFKQIMKICRKNYKEVEKDKEQELWYMVCETIQSFIKNDLFKNKLYAKQYFRNRLMVFSEQLVRAIPFQQYLEYQLTINKWLRFKDFGEVIRMELNNVSSECLVLSNANAAIFKFNSEMFQEYQMSSRKGFLFRQRLCTMCKRYMDSFLYNEFSSEMEDQSYLLASRNEEEQEDDNPDTFSQPIKVFACQHNFHLNCLERHFRRRKKNESDVSYQRRIEKLRCPTCNLKTYELESMSSSGLNGPRGQRRTPRSNAHQQLQSQQSYSTQQSNKFDFSRFESSQSIIIKQGGSSSKEINSFIRKESQISGASNEEQNMSDKTELWERERQKKIQKQQAAQQRQMELIKKRMDKFDMELDIDGLAIKDFQQV